VYNVLLVDIHNAKDNITVENQAVPESCTRRSVVGDYMRYHYNGTFLNGLTFDTRYTEVKNGLKNTTREDKKCIFLLNSNLININTKTTLNKW